MASAAQSNTFLPVPERPHFPTEEESTLKYWEDIDAFKESLRRSEEKPAYNFYDGPPFATGLPHYGHILAGTIKDAVTRYAAQNGFHVERRFGWDCHGLPIEQIIDKELNLKGRQAVLEYGIDKYNEKCRSIVQKYVKEWRTVITRFGRWIDFDNDYKTMQLSYMESVWWVFKQLFDQGNVYRAFRVMPFSTACCTPLSNFEVGQNYKEVSDPSIIIQLKHATEENTYILAWTTTPWTLPSNLALCVNPELDYLKVKRKADGQVWYVGKPRFAWVCGCIKKDPKKDFEILEELKGHQLVGIRYLPLFDYFQGKALDKAWHIYSDMYVGAEAGTCIVHQAPAFGEDDNRVCQANGVTLKDGTGNVCPVDEKGCFTDAVTDFKGQHVKEADKGIKEMLKSKGQLLHNGMETHSYPHCWRSDTPLIYKAVPSWFVKVEEHREKIIGCNNQTTWVPSFVKEKRFHNWLSEARDWCVSRNRYWGCPLPLWCSSDFEEIVCIGSVAELEEYAGRKITDLHSHCIDDIRIPSKMGKGELKRVDEVFDCWFESGSMPYAQKHYPFENKETFEASFPAQFVAEGLDQTRGWFYTLMVISSLLFEKPPFQNLITNGLILASDGKKMSKRLKNYPDPVDVVNTHGADAVRMYLVNSPVVRAEPLKFKEEGVRDVVKDVFLPWFNAYRFFVQESVRYEAAGTPFKPDVARVKKSLNTMDRWINAKLHDMIGFVREEMEGYRLYTVVPKLVDFLNDLTNWYVRLNRDRMRGSNGAEEALTSLCTMFEVLINVSVLLAPITPFITEMIYVNLQRALPEGHELKAPSVHFVQIPKPDTEALDTDILTAVERMQAVVELGRTCRERRKVGLKMPIKSLKIQNVNTGYIKDLESLEGYVKEELNVVDIIYSSKADNVLLVPNLNFSVLGKKLGKDMKAVIAAVKELSQEDLSSYEKSGSISVCGHDITSELMTLSQKGSAVEDPNLGSITDGSETTLILDFTYDEDLALMALARDVVNRVQRLRKDAKLQQDDAVDMWARVIPGKKGGSLTKVLTNKGDYINKLLRRPLFDASSLHGTETVVKAENFEFDGGDVLSVVITTRGAFVNGGEINKLCGGNKNAEEACRQFLASYSYESLVKVSGDIQLCYEGKSLKLERNKHFSVGPAEATWLKK